jgi:putative endonuclease
MANHTDLGKEGEKKAFDFLRKIGYTILETNWRHGKAEIDIIAENDDYLAIVEVKTRTNEVFGQPEMFVNKQKQKHLIRAAHAYAEKNSVGKNIYFDIVTVVLKPLLKVEHIREAFYPE